VRSARLDNQRLQHHSQHEQRTVEPPPDGCLRGVGVASGDGLDERRGLGAAWTVARLGYSIDLDSGR
jgi:hypothetical protein